jgi:hypothetical protein
LRPTVFGAVDGLVTNASLIAGLGGGGVPGHTIILTGVAALVAGAFSMGTGEYVSVTNQTELVHAEVATECTMHARSPAGAPPYSWFVVDNIGELPPGLTLDTTAPDFNNVLTGTPTQAGTFSFPMQVQDSQDNMVSATMTITIKP